ncbi:MAG: hypothetical protein L3J86_04715 [Thermoplasmata archaeon]|nr:hypothetical protein [Thermoplasmata archaeon]
MKLDALSILLFVAAVGLVALAFRTGNDTGLSGPLIGALAALCALAIALRGFRARMPLVSIRVLEPSPSPSLLVAGAFGSDRFGRQQVYETILMLEAHFAGHPMHPPAGEEDRLARVSDAEFRQWAGARLEELERES